MSGVDGTTQTYSGSPVVVAPGLTLTSGSNILGAVVLIGTGFNVGGVDELKADNLPSGIEASYDSDKGVLTLSGAGTPAMYQTALRNVTFSTTATGTSREITLAIGTALPNPDNGHFYRHVNSFDSWSSIYTTQFPNSFGRQGYLATITSQVENDFVANKICQEGWLGATNDYMYHFGQESSWVWVTGPESGTTFYSIVDGTIEGKYCNWDSGEPNLSSHAGLRFLNTGKWADEDFSNSPGYYVEFGGMPSDNPVTISGTVTVNLESDSGTTMIAIRNVRRKNRSDQLCRIPDLETGIPEVVGNLGRAYTSTKCIAVLPGESGTNDRIFAAEDGVLLEVNATTGAATPIGSIGWLDVTGLTVHPTTRVLYGITFGTNKLLTIDTTTGAGTVVASNVLNGSRLNDLTFDPNGGLYVVTNSKNGRVYKISPTTGKKIRRWNLTGGTSLEALLWSEDGTTLYSAAVRDGYKDLCTIDLSARTVSFVSTLSSRMREIEGLAWFSGTVGSSKPAALVDDEPEDIEDPDEFLDAGADDAIDDEDVVAAVRGRVALLGNTPNPFNPSTRIEFELEAAADVLLAVYDIAGRHVATLAGARFESGRHAVTWNGRTDSGRPVASGVYFYRLRSGSEVQTRSMILVQ